MAKRHIHSKAGILGHVTQTTADMVSAQKIVVQIPETNRHFPRDGPLSARADSNRRLPGCFVARRESHVRTGLVAGEVYHGVRSQKQPVAEVIAQTNSEQRGKFDAMRPQVLSDHTDVKSGKGPQRKTDVERDHASDRTQIHAVFSIDAAVGCGLRGWCDVAAQLRSQ